MIEFSEEVRKAYGLRPLNYEVGSDRWGLMDIDSTRQLLSLVLRGIKDGVLMRLEYCSWLVALDIRGYEYVEQRMTNIIALSHEF